ncbi:hypothetical protein ACFQWB_06565 [Paenibacillus thermoaerophilus]|uniref:Uncharacterized protein n=1 Tax=Paenibacillus thermoaerophilus TaxID=1215385 RepID=A0ABW2V248_9BACL|nr:hypothetical protein [Paenibacillus thermoaerophilus]TMV18148.1 hypothetical protein FE781_04095 [Paenibacillus thermoaerophilus]
MAKKIISILLVLVLVLTSASSVMAQNKDESQAQKPLTKEEIQKIHQEFEKHKDKLQVTPEEPYKEVKLDNGYTLFASIKEVPVTESSSSENALTTSNASAADYVQQTKEIVSSQGAKNAVGWVLYQMDFHTRWTYDYSKVVDGYSWVTVFNGAVWTFKASSVYGPNKANYNMEWDWTGAATFAYIVAGYELYTTTLTTLHLVRYDGSYAWRFV